MNILLIAKKNQSRKKKNLKFHSFENFLKMQNLDRSRQFQEKFTKYSFSTEIQTRSSVFFEKLFSTWEANIF